MSGDTGIPLRRQSTQPQAHLPTSLITEASRWARLDWDPRGSLRVQAYLHFANSRPPPSGPSPGLGLQAAGAPS